LRLHVDALSSAMESDKKFFASVIPYVRELARLVRLPSTEATKSMFAAPVKRLIEFYADYQSSSSPGFVYVSPTEISNTDATVREISDLITKLTTLPDDQFAACFQPPTVWGRTLPKPPGAEKAAAIFIGHGRSKEWLELEKYLTRELHLGCEEFNAEPPAGYTTQERLEAMLEKATFAFLVMTAEDQHSDGTIHARENVIHEAGLFQGKLGIPNAVLLIEAGCATPSDISGLTYIPFPSGNIRAAFYEVSSVLKARGIIGA